MVSGVLETMDEKAGPVLKSPNNTLEAFGTTSMVVLALLLKADLCARKPSKPLLTFARHTLQHGIFASHQSPGRGAEIARRTYPIRSLRSGEATFWPQGCWSQADLWRMWHTWFVVVDQDAPPGRHKNQSKSWNTIRESELFTPRQDIGIREANLFMVLVPFAI